MSYDDAPAAKIEIHCTCPAMPNQFEGVVNGKPFYFRARHGFWTLRVSDDPAVEGINGAVVAEGEDGQAGWWDVPLAEAVCRNLLEEYANADTARQGAMTNPRAGEPPQEGGSR